eukprot:9503806-Pyramimonas_sp.AAC.1
MRPPADLIEHVRCTRATLQAQVAARVEEGCCDAASCSELSRRAGCTHAPAESVEAQRPSAGRAEMCLLRRASLIRKTVRLWSPAAPSSDTGARSTSVAWPWVLWATWTLVRMCVSMSDDPRITSPSLKLSIHRSTVPDASTSGAVMAAWDIMISVAG